ncbi:ricin-type beta-trefoil lectin domain protein [Streptomyces sp. NPDC096057]|uniref:ricin-type beta-trefoil lectin domain protein n=1 Tax=Streptomyces sp. NPDC096057 TaxID=3155543 RepID=UPI003329AD43
MIAGAVAAATVLVAGSITATLLLHDNPGPSAGSPPKAPPALALPENSSSGAASSPSGSPTASATKANASQKPSAAPAAQNPASLDIRVSSCVHELAAGAHGDCVKALQLLLAGHGLHVTVDGDYGATTIDAVKVFQTEAGTAATGTVDAHTAKLLYGTPRGPVRAGSVTVTESVDARPVPRCLDAHAGAVQVWACNGTSAQRWALFRVPGHTSQYLVVHQGSHDCLDADAGTIGRNGQKIRVAACDGLGAQRWRLGASAQPSGRTLVSVPDGFCLDADAPTSGQNGQRVQGFSCAGSSNQAWNWAP